MLLDFVFIDFDPIKYPKYANVNEYMFIMPDSTYNVIHRHASNVTLAMFFDSFAITWNDACFIISPETENVKRERFEILEYCNDGDSQTRLYVNGQLNEEGHHYVVQDNEKLLITFDNKTKTERSYKIG
ncbi:MAG: hypothetical protein IIA83_00205 [Thaumarchaeota archaeon]|nr:hypothetical protein [Nitrososphaerota archaeon]